MQNWPSPPHYFSSTCSAMFHLYEEHRKGPFKNALAVGGGMGYEVLYGGGGGLA